MAQESNINSTSIDPTAKPKMNWARLKSSLYVFKYIRPYRWQFFGGLVSLALSSLLFLELVPLSGKMLDIALGKSEWNISLSEAGLILLAILVIQGCRSVIFCIFNHPGGVCQATHDTHWGYFVPIDLQS